MKISEYKDHLIEAVAAQAAGTSDQATRQALEGLVAHLREMGPDDTYLADAWREHGQLPDEAQRKDALHTALEEFHTYDRAEQLATVFLIDLVHAARPQEGFV